MLIKITVKNIKTGNFWNEEYNINNSQDPETFAKNLIEKFNSTIRPHESPRELIGIEVMEAITSTFSDHKWRKQNAVTVIRGSNIFDIMKCEVCGVTGKRHGLNNYVQRDAKYKSNTYEKCETALAQTKKNEERKIK